MRLRQRLLIIVLSIFLLSLGAGFGINHFMIEKTFSHLEEASIVKDCMRIKNALTDEIDYIDHFVYDWSAWDDTYEYMVDRNMEYVQSNIIDETFASINLNLIAYFDVDGEEALFMSYDFQNEKELILSKPIKEAVISEMKMKPIDSILKGILSIGDTSLILSMRPIITSDEEGPARGTLIMARYVDDELIEKISNKTKIDAHKLTLSEFYKIANTTDYKHISLESEVKIDILSDIKSIAYFSIQAINENKYLIFSANFNRDIYQHWVNTSRSVIILFFSIFLILFIIIYRSLQWMIINPVMTLRSFVRDIAENKNFSSRLKEISDDEIGDLSAGLNIMVSELEKYDKKMINQKNILELKVKERTAVLQNTNTKLELEAIQRKNAEYDLKKSEEKFRHIYENLVIGIYRTSPEGKIIMCNNALVKMLGYDTFEELKGIDISFNYNNEANNRKDFINKINEKGEITGLEYAWRSKSGKKLFIRESVKAILNSNGDIKYFDGVIEDITDHKMVENALVISEQRFKASFNASADIIIIIEASNETVYINDAGKKYFQLNKEEEKRYLIDELFRNEPKSWLKKIAKVFKTGVMEMFQENYFRESETIYSIISISPLIDRGQVYAVVFNHRDLTKEYLLREQINQMQKMESIGLLTSRITHDFNNMLTVINGFADMGMKNYKDDETIYRYFDNIFSAGTKASDLTRQLLAFSRKQILKTKILNINNIINDLDKILLRLIGTEININYKLEEDLPAINADPSQLEQVIINLAINARDAILENKSLDKKYINISTKFLTQDPKGLTPESENGYIGLLIEDSGIGISKIIEASVFEPFFSTKEIGKGTGLGLSTVYGIIQQNNGSIRILNPGQSGAKFMIYWPVADDKGDVDQKNEIKQQVAAPVENRDSKKILIIDKDKEILEFLSFGLEKNNYIVDTASDCAEIKKITIENPYDLILVDIVATDQLLENLNNYCKKFPGAQIIYTAGQSIADFADKIEDFGSDRYLAKPFTIEQLMEKIHAIT